MDDRVGRKRFAARYSLGALLFLVTCVCGYLGGYRAGYRDGDNVWQYRQTITTAYNVSDLVVPRPNLVDGTTTGADFSQLLAVIRDQLKDQPANEAQVHPFDANLSLIVMGNGVVHRRIRTLLEELRQSGARSITNSTARAGESTESRL
jgi:hypothetical protein